LNTSSRKAKTIEFKFYAKPLEVLGDDKVNGIRLEINRLNKKNNVIGTGETFELKAGLIITAIGYHGEKIDGIPFDEQSGKIINKENIVDNNLYTAGWIARGPTGVIGTNKHDGDRVAKGIAEKKFSENKKGRSKLKDFFSENKIKYINKLDWRNINEEEIKRANNGAPRKKFIDFDEMYKFINK